jgi:hypothetical protein
VIASAKRVGRPSRGACSEAAGRDLLLESNILKAKKGRKMFDNSPYFFGLVRGLWAVVDDFCVLPGFGCNWAVLIGVCGELW